MDELYLFLLGRPLIKVADAPVEGFISEKALALLCYLVVEEGDHSRAALAGLLWGEMPEARAKANLRMALYNLQQLFPGFFLGSRTAVGLKPNRPVWLDVTTFLSSIEARPPDPGALRHAVELYRGDFLKDLFVEEAPEFEAWLMNKREQLRLAMLQALEKLAHFHSTRGEWVENIELTRRILAIEPWHEAAHRQLMRSLARRGEYNAALAQYEICQRVLAEELGVEPMPETVSLYVRIRQAREQPARHNLPSQPTPIVGREEELQEIARLIANPDCRLLTLVGPGGIGKSRTALQAASNQVGAFLDGIYLASLAGVNSVEVLPSAIASGLGIELQGQAEPRIQILNSLRDKELLLLLDDFEHLLEGASLVTAILQHAPEVKILITSRERLNIQSEWVFPIEGLSCPEPDQLTEIERCSAVALFSQAARQAQKNFFIEEADRLCVARICHLVQGMPLALELASSWTRFLACQEIVHEIEHGIGILSASTRDIPDRHRSMRAVFDHSWKHLSMPEETVLRRLSVFRGGFTRQTAEQVAGSSLAVLSALVDKSLLQAGLHPAQDRRYDLHELVRQYAGEQLAIAGEATEVQDRHLSTFLQMAESVDRVIHTGEYPAWLFRLESEIDNLRAALAWGLITPSGPEAGLRLAGELGWYWYFANHWREGRNWAERMLAVPGNEDFPIARAKALFTAGGMALLMDEYPFAERYLEESEILFRKGNDPRGLGYTLCAWGAAHLNQGNLAPALRLEEESAALFQTIQDKPGCLFATGILGDVHLYRGEYAQAKENYNICLDLSQELGNIGGLAYAFLNLGDIARRQGDFELARVHLEQSLELAGELGIQRFRALALHNLGRVTQDQCQIEQARTHLVKSLRLFHDLEDRMGVIGCLERLANQALVQSEYERAAKLFGAAAVAREAVHIPVPLGEQALLDQDLASIQSFLGAAKFDQAWSEGRAMTLEQAIAIAAQELPKGA